MAFLCGVASKPSPEGHEQTRVVSTRLLRGTGRLQPDFAVSLTSPRSVRLTSSRGERWRGEWGRGAVTSASVPHATVFPVPLLPRNCGDRPAAARGPRRRTRSWEGLSWHPACGPAAPPNTAGQEPSERAAGPRALADKRRSVRAATEGVGETAGRSRGCAPLCARTPGLCRAVRGLCKIRVFESFTFW